MILNEWCDSNHVGKATYYKSLKLIRKNLLDNPSLSTESLSKNSFIMVFADLSENKHVIITKEAIELKLNMTVT